MLMMLGSSGFLPKSSVERNNSQLTLVVLVLT